ncbi:hypothetical protein M9Y10_007759 [Tritrichomonas musculus]|uniref:Uncharacterized protein n=1 Tax=Tritrichomonas musculus TaxID=1915356 RepID=A0ABR2J475_9EUKA
MLPIILWVITVCAVIHEKQEDDLAKLSLIKMMTSKFGKKSMNLKDFRGMKAEKQRRKNKKKLKKRLTPKYPPGDYKDG